MQSILYSQFGIQERNKAQGKTLSVCHGQIPGSISQLSVCPKAALLFCLALAAVTTLSAVVMMG